MSQEQYLQKLARYSGDIRTGGLNFDYRTGQCSPSQPVQARSWGAACPAGFCPPANLPEALGRYFAGDRAGCREIPYTVSGSVTTSATLVTTLTIERNSKVTMCPTRVIMASDAGQGIVQVVSMQFGNQNQIVGGPVDISVFGIQSFQLVPFVPDCLFAGQPFSLQFTLQPEAGPPTREVYVTFIGPVVG